MKRLMLAALLAFVLVIGNFVIVPWAIAQASGCDDRASGISKVRHLAVRCHCGVKGLRLLRKVCLA